MSKNPISLILVVFAFLLFIGLSLFIWLRRSKTKKAVRIKLKMGAFIISTLGIINTGCPVVSCYDQPAMDQLYITSSSNADSISMVYNVNHDLQGEIYNRQSEQFSFAVTDINDTGLVQLNDIFSNDGTMDEETEQFNISIDSIPSGAYHLHLLVGPASAYQNGSYTSRKYYIEMYND